MDSTKSSPRPHGSPCINLLLHIYLLALQVIVALDDDGVAEAGGGRQGQLQVAQARYVWKIKIGFGVKIGVLYRSE